MGNSFALSATKEIVRRARLHPILVEERQRKVNYIMGSAAVVLAFAALTLVFVDGISSRGRLLLVLVVLLTAAMIFAGIFALVAIWRTSVAHAHLEMLNAKQDAAEATEELLRIMELLRQVETDSELPRKVRERLIQLAEVRLRATLASRVDERTIQLAVEAIDDDALGVEAVSVVERHVIERSGLAVV